MQNYHTHSGVILRPWLTFPDQHFLGDDKYIYETLGQMGVEETGYPLISVYEDFTPDKNLKRYRLVHRLDIRCAGHPHLQHRTLGYLQRCRHRT